MNGTPFTNISNDLTTAFTAGLNSTTSNILSAVSAPLMATVTLWIIVQGILVMRGDTDARGGVTRIIRVALIVGLLTSAGLYTTYVQSFFSTGLPNWIASSVVTTNPAGTPQAFDQIWQMTVHEIAAVQAQLNMFDVIDGVSLALIELAVNIILLATFAIYVIAQVMLGVVLAIGPLVLVGYLFDATRRVAENWLGKVIGLTILTLLINVVMEVIISGDRTYMNSISSFAASGGTISGQIMVLFELAMFLGVSAFIVVLLPGIAAYIGGGIGFSIGGAARTAAAIVSGGASRVVASGARSAGPRATAAAAE